MIILRPATEADQKTIVAIIRQVRINPMRLKWPNFIVAVDDATGQIVGIGQVKTHGDGSRELASIAVLPGYRRRGIARQIIQRLMAQHGNAGTLFLTCQSSLGQFYEQFGFRAIGEQEMTPYFRRLMKVASVIGLLARDDETLLVMKRDVAMASEPWQWHPHAM